MENNIPTAEEFLKDFELGKTGKVDIEDTKQALIEFAKLHVEAALKKASEDVEINYYDEHEQYSPHINEKQF